MDTLTNIKNLIINPVLYIFNYPIHILGITFTFKDVTIVLFVFSIFIFVFRFFVGGKD